MYIQAPASQSSTTRMRSSFISPLESSIGPDSPTRLLGTSFASHASSILEKLSRGISAYHPSLEKDLTEALTILDDADSHLNSKRSGRCQIDRDPTDSNKFTLMVYDVHERDRIFHVKGTSKTVKTENYRISIELNESEMKIISVQKGITLAKDSPILSPMRKLNEIANNEELFNSMSDDEIGEVKIEYARSYHQLQKEGFTFIDKLAKNSTDTHQVPWQENLGEPFLRFISEQKSTLSPEQKEKLVLSILQAVSDLFAKDSFHIFDIKLENMVYIMNEEGEIKVNLVDHTVQGETLAKLPSTFQDVVLADTIDEETGLNSPEIETLKVSILTLVSCVEILDDSEKVHIHLMSKEQIAAASAKLDAILQGPHNPFPFMTPENYAEASAHIKSAGFGG